jgi:hypothetical protein
VIGSATQELSFDVSLMSMILSGNVNVVNLNMCILGKYFSFAETTPKLRLLQSSIFTSSWISTTSLFCMAGSDSSGTRWISVTAGLAVGSSSQMISTLFSILSTGRASNLGTSGASSVTVLGMNLGLNSYTAWAHMGMSVCESSQWQSQTAVQCKALAGQSSSLRMSMSIGGAVGSLTLTLSFGAARPSTIRASNHGLTGSSRLTLQGVNYGQVNVSPRVQTWTSCEMSVWINDSSIRCNPSGGLRACSRVSASVGACLGSVSNFVTFDAYSISSASQSNQIVSGLHSLTVFGGSLGISAHSLKTRFGQTSCEESAWRSDTALQCISSQGASISMRLIVTVGHIPGATCTQTISYDSPVLFKPRFMRYYFAFFNTGFYSLFCVF